MFWNVLEPHTRTDLPLLTAPADGWQLPCVDAQVEVRTPPAPEVPGQWLLEAGDWLPAVCLGTLPWVGCSGHLAEAGLGGPRAGLLSSWQSTGLGALLAPCSLGSGCVALSVPRPSSEASGATW